jgi:hypothetical protein
MYSDWKRGPVMAAKGSCSLRTGLIGQVCLLEVVASTASEKKLSSQAGIRREFSAV